MPAYASFLCDKPGMLGETIKGTFYVSTFFIRRVRVVANSARELNHVHPPARLCSCTGAAPTGRISVKFDIEDINDGLSGKNFGAFYVKTKVPFIVPGDIPWP
jgi:hypothetical protein